jgi:histidinol-phosphate aminotransferase
MKKTEQQLVRPNILQLKPYSCARDEFKGEAKAYFDANENPFNDPYNRYPDPLQLALKQKIAKIKGISAENIFLGNGSDEPIDLIYRVFCEPAKDNVVAINPTYGMYQVCADINNVEYRKVNLKDDYLLDGELVLKACDENTKVIFLCSPNNPTGNCLIKNEILKVINGFDGIVIIDEAYCDFAPGQSFLPDLQQYPNLIILQTFSKAWGLASVRLGMAFASTTWIGHFNNVKYPYNINVLTQNFVSERLEKVAEKQQWVDVILSERQRVKPLLEELNFVEKVYPSDANFYLVKVTDANAVYNYLVNRGIIVRNRNTVSLCGNCLRITIGTPDENNLLIESLDAFSC